MVDAMEETDDYYIYYWRKVPKQLPQSMQRQEIYLESRDDSFPIELRDGRQQTAGVSQTINEDLSEEYPFRALVAKNPITTRDASFFHYPKRPVKVRTYTSQRGYSHKPTRTRAHTRRKPTRS